MQRTLIYYRLGQIDLAKELQDNYIAHQKRNGYPLSDVYYQ